MSLWCRRYDCHTSITGVCSNKIDYVRALVAFILIALLCFSTLQNFHKQSKSFIFSANLAVLKKYKTKHSVIERKHNKNRSMRAMSNRKFSSISFFNYFRKLIIQIVGFIRYRDLVVEATRYEHAERYIEKIEDRLSDIIMILFPMQVSHTLII